MTELPVSFFPEARPAALVGSHPRSGTHFLINSLAKCYGYQNQPWLNLDPINMPVNYYEPTKLADVLLSVASRPLANVVKSHHPAEFFAAILPQLSSRYAIFYVYRNPVAVLLSCWRFMHRWGWAGPCLPDPLAYARAQPCGGQLRYLLRQQPDLMRMWAAHVESWLDAAAAHPAITLVRYEDLDAHFEPTVRSFSRVLGRQPHALLRPSREANVVPGGPEDPTGLGTPPDRHALERLCRDTIGSTMSRLGY